MKIRFIHTADLHLETPFKGLLDNNDGLANKLKDATFSAFKNIVNNCISLRVDFLVIAGDILTMKLKAFRHN
jgi:exonuclease SbcD